MKHIFDKNLLPLIKELSQKNTSGRKFWGLTRIYQKQDGLTYNPASVLMLLQQGANRNDPWSMCELARFYFDSKVPEHLPLALSWWRKAVTFHDKGTLADLKNRDICARIDKLRLHSASEYANMEMKCTLYAEWILTDLGQSDWNAMDLSEKCRRIQCLIQTVSKILHIKPPEFLTRDPAEFNGQRGWDGLAASKEWQLLIRTPVLNNYERLIQVLFHELGHFVIFSMWYHNDAASLAQRKRFEITTDRVEGWYQQKIGIALPCTEEDADTLSYGVYTNWVILFKPVSAS